MASPYNQMITNFAYHVSEIMRAPAPSEFHLALGTKVVEVEIKPARGGLASPVWDQVFLNGRWTGNRCGGRDAYARLMAGVLQEAANGHVA